MRFPSYKYFAHVCSFGNASGVNGTVLVGVWIICPLASVRT